jgi:hypothetical protein
MVVRAVDEHPVYIEGGKILKLLTLGCWRDAAQFDEG